MMATNNSLTQRQTFNSAAIEYDSNGTTVKLSPAIVRNYLVNGNGAVSDQEVVMFLNLCKAQRLNPFLREAYLIKYGSNPATIVTGKEVFTKRARRSKDYAGHEAGVVVQTENGLEYRTGTLVLDGEKIVGGWAKVHMHGYSMPIETAVTFTEYCLYKDGKPASNWAVKPATMIRKVALVQALREAFPEELQGMYDQDEMPIDAAELASEPVVLEPAYEELPREEPTAAEEFDPFA